MAKTLCDPACLKLAAHFLQDELMANEASGEDASEAYVQYEARVDALAAAIQEAVETWTAFHPAEAAAKKGAR